MKTFCAYFNQNICRSCTYLEQTYPDQIQHKETTLLASLNISRESLLPTVLSPEKAFRNKAKFSVTGTLEQPIIGLTGESDLDQGREILDCPLHLSKINSAVKDLIPLIQNSKLVPYSIAERKGELKGIIIFYTEATDSMYIRLVVRSKESIDRIKKYLSDWIQSHPFVKSFSLNIQPQPHAILEGSEEIYLTPESSIQLSLNQVKMGLSPQGFVQTNQLVATKLYETAALWVKDTKAHKFLELFCGQGAFSFFVGPVVKECLGVEINPKAIQNAQKTVEHQGLKNLRFIAEDAKNMRSTLASFGADVILVNPPRRGLGESLDMIKNSGAAHVIYSSCSHESLARDLKELEKSYKIEKAQIFDMFPHTKHFETLVLLKLQ